MLENTEETIKKGQFRETDSIGCTRRRKKTPPLCTSKHK